ncbi:hypothetical protein FV226_05200 [Methylobacterium sp. WL12]|uniref:NepR family anti-sigma factor n=1 Tax=unclassified Methylobacterium TaxID=2615210 RepID=UPI0011CA3D3B|nr:hypothetical protein FV229_17140 [Methylobacterium sp. WL120]TXM74776.1 hypothetical protein FV226_05200 [Methylobacterium sp. WL12]
MTDAAKAERPIGRGRAGDGIADGGGVSRTIVPDSAGRHRGSSRLSDHAQARIGNTLRSLYDGLIQQPVPDRFRDLIERLDAKEPESP